MKYTLTGDPKRWPKTSELKVHSLLGLRDSVPDTIFGI